MTLEEAIKHAEEVAEKCEFDTDWGMGNHFIDRSGVADKIKCGEEHRQLAEWLKELKRLREQTRWIPCSERLPKDSCPVNITWVNHNPESYYTDIKDKPFTSTGHYCNGRWWWHSVTCQDYLDEYGRCDVDAMDDDIEVIAWMPLPESYKLESEDKK